MHRSLAAWIAARNRDAGSESKIRRVEIVATIRVLVFGATGAGKTSLCNVLTRRSRPIGGGAQGVTAASHCYAPFSYRHHSIHVCDTAGLHESAKGTVPADKAVLQLVELLENARDGFSILVHVAAHPARITREHDEDHNFFVEKLAQGKIPALLAVTRCEQEQPMMAWADRNKAALARFGYAAVIPGCFATGGAMEAQLKPLRQQSRKALLNEIVEHALRKPHRVYGAGTGRTFSQALTQIWNEFVDWAKLPAAYRRELNESVYGFMKRLGVSEAVARAAIRHIPDLVEELGNKAPVPGLGKILRFAATKALSRFTNKK